MVLAYDDGRRAIFDGNRHLDHAAENHRLTLGECLVEGTKGTLTLDGNGAVHFRAFGSTLAEMVFAPQQWQGFGGDCVYELQRHVVSSLTKGTELENTAETYLRILEIEAAVYQSDMEKRRVDIRDGSSSSNAR